MKNILLILNLCFLITIINAQEVYKPNAERTEIKAEVKVPFSEEMISVDAELVDGKIILEGDMIIGDQNSSETGRGLGAVKDIDRRWPNATIPYVIVAGHPKKSDILEAINNLNGSTNLNIIERTTEKDYVEVMNPAKGCSSWVGRRGDRQEMNISTGCSIGSIMHEFLHASGFFHEQCRRDRGEHIIIKEDNIIAAKKKNFKKYSYGEGVALGPYDYESIMHYGSNYFAIDKSKPTIVTKDKSKQHLIGNRAGLSKQDIRQVNRAYGTDGKSHYTNKGRGGSPETSWDYGDSQSFSIQYEVELVPQMTGMSCWAAGAAMLVGWSDEICINPEEIANGIGYWSQYHNGGLPPDDTKMFEAWGLETEPPMSYTVEGFRDLIATFGPLWVATREPGPHIRVISGIEGDGTPDGTILTIYDPWQRGMRRFRTPNPGSIYTETYTEFMRKQAELARTEFDIAAPIYIAHN